MGYLQLEGPDWGRICKTLGTSFDVLALSRLVKAEFPQVAGEVAWIGMPEDQIVFDIVGTANRHGELDRLLTKAAENRPARHELRALTYDLAQGRLGCARAIPRPRRRRALEALTTSGQPFFDTSKLAWWLIRVERQVCLVRCGDERGTGFLVGPNLVLTCYHVIKSHLNGSVPASALGVRFDYRRSMTGAEPAENPGDWIGADPAWKIPHAPYSQADITLVGDPAPGELDDALLKLTRAVGSEVPPGESSARGWADLAKDPHLPNRKEPILIVQHPEREQKPPPQMPLQIAFATPGFEGDNSNGTRLLYTPSTRRGSSGSPVFDRTLEVVALHHNRGQISAERLTS